MLIMKKWLLAVGILTPFVLYGAHPIWRSLEPLMPPSTEGGPNLSKEEIDKKIKEIKEASTWATEKSKTVKVDVDQARNDVQSAATFEPPAQKSEFKEMLSQRAYAAKNTIAFGDPLQSFVGDDNIQKKFENLRKSQGKLRTFESMMDAWFLGEVNENAVNALKSFREDLIIPYSKADASPVKVAEYEMRGRHAIAKAFSAQLLKEFNLRIEKNALPINPSDATPLLKGMDDLIDMCAQFARVYSNAPDQARKNPDMERKSNEMLGLDAEWQACNELSNLFSRDPVGMTSSDVADWFVRVGLFMSKLSTDSTKALIKQKVQQFCGAVIPEKLALDDQVLYADGNLYKRDQLFAQFEKVGGNSDDKDYIESRPLSFDPAELNERTYEDKKLSPPGYALGMIGYPKGTISPKRLKTTPRSAAAFDYFKARQQVPSENGWKRVVLDRMLEAAAESEKTPGQQWDPLSLPGVAKQKPYDVLQKLNAIRTAMTNLGTQSLFPDR
jgi:hypothetical protein